MSVMNKEQANAIIETVTGLKDTHPHRLEVARDLATALNNAVNTLEIGQ